MNWKLVLMLSMFGLAMGLATVFFIPPNVEPAFWLLIFVLCAFLIARGAPGNPFQHGFYTGLVNSVWITAAHLLFSEQYIAGHPQEAALMQMLPGAPRLLMALTGPMVGVVSGAVIGVLAFLASRFVKPAGVRPA